MPRHPYLRKLLHRRSGGAENEPQRACLHTQPQNRIRVSELQPAAENHFGGERRAAAFLQLRNRSQGAPTPRRGSPRRRGAARPHDAQVEPDVGRTAAACGNRPRACQRPGADSCRRGYRQPRHAHIVQHSDAVPAAAQHGSHRHFRDPQPGAFRLQQPQHRASRRQDHLRRAQSQPQIG